MIMRQVYIINSLLDLILENRYGYRKSYQDYKERPKSYYDTNPLTNDQEEIQWTVYPRHTTKHGFPNHTSDS